MLPTGVASLMLVEYGRPMKTGGLSLKSRTGISRRNETVFGSDPYTPSSKGQKFNFLIELKE